MPNTDNLRKQLNDLLADEDLTDEKLRAASKEFLPQLADYLNAPALSEGDINAAEKTRTEAFIEAVEPLMKWLAENQHPHTTCIVTSNRAELVEGVKVHMAERFIVD